LGPAFRILACTFSPDGRYLLTGNSDGRLALWDVSNARKLREFDAHAHAIVSCLFSPDGRRVLSCAQNDQALQIRDSASGGLVATLEVGSEGITECGYSPDGRSIAAAAADGRLRRWTRACGEPAAEFVAHTGPVAGLAWSGDSRRLASAGRDLQLIWWDAASGRDTGRFLLDSPAMAVGRETSTQAFIVQDDAGETILLQEAGVVAAHAPFVTAVRLYRFDTGQWDDEPTAACPWCSRRFVLEQSALDAIDAIGREAGLPPDAAPSEHLADEAWSDARLATTCTQCRRAVRLNPFVAACRVATPE
jgi:hypothetical protein